MNKTKTLVLLLAAFLMTTLGGCKKEDDNDSGNDLTSGVVGHYRSGSGSGLEDIYVTRINDNTISIVVESAYGDFLFGNCTMTSATAFTLNTYVDNNAGNNGDQTDTYTGSGSASGDVISILYHQRRTDSGGSLVFEDDDSFNGNRQGVTGDLTADIVGHYQSGSGSGLEDIYVTRINNNTISIVVDAAYGNFTFGNCTMTTSTAFTLSTYVDNNAGNNGDQTDTYTGTGSYSGNVISLIYNQRRTDSGGSLVFEDDDSFNGIRQ